MRPERHCREEVPPIQPQSRGSCGRSQREDALASPGSGSAVCHAKLRVPVGGIAFGKTARGSLLFLVAMWITSLGIRPYPVAMRRPSRSPQGTAQLGIDRCGVKVAVRVHRHLMDE